MGNTQLPGLANDVSTWSLEVARGVFSEHLTDDVVPVAVCKSLATAHDYVWTEADDMWVASSATDDPSASVPLDAAISRARAAVQVAVRSRRAAECHQLVENVRTAMGRVLFDAAAIDGVTAACGVIADVATASYEKKGDADRAMLMAAEACPAIVAVLVGPAVSSPGCAAEALRAIRRLARGNEDFIRQFVTAGAIPYMLQRMKQYADPSSPDAIQVHRWANAAILALLWNTSAETHATFRNANGIEAVVDSIKLHKENACLLYTSPSPRDRG